MDHADYVQHISKAHREEWLGEAISGILAEKFGSSSPDRAKIELLGRLEGRTADVLAPVMKRHAIPLADRDAIVAEGQLMSADIHDWKDLTSFFRSALPPIVVLFDELAQQAAEGDGPALSFLAEHERALLHLAKASDEDAEAAALDQIRDLVTRAETMIATAPSQ